MYLRFESAADLLKLFPGLGRGKRPFNAGEEEEEE